MLGCQSSQRTLSSRSAAENVRGYLVFLVASSLRCSGGSRAGGIEGGGAMVALPNTRLKLPAPVPNGPGCVLDSGGLGFLCDHSSSAPPLKRDPLGSDIA